MKQVWLVLGLFITSWSYADVPKTVQSATVSVTVEADGQTIDEARHVGFKTAIEQVVGVVLISEQEVQGDRLTKDFIGNYSSGYVDDYEIIESYQDQHNRWHVKMNVQVASSKIAQRMLANAKNDRMIDGPRIAAQIESQLDQRRDGDQLIATVLNTYPENAYIINNGQTEFKISRLRKPYMEIDYRISMSKFWVEALNEALDLVAVNSKHCNSMTGALVKAINRSGTNSLKVKAMANDLCGSEPDIRVEHKASGAWMSSIDNYYFADQQTFYMINREFQSRIGRDHLGLRVDLIDAGGNSLDSGCFKIDQAYFIGYEQPRGVYNLNSKKINMRPFVGGLHNIAGKLQVGIPDNIPLDDIARVRLSIQKTCN
jgi:hypothetical protein